jgi:hypothetical protein
MILDLARDSGISSDKRLMQSAVTVEWDFLSAAQTLQIL